MQGAEGSDGYIDNDTEGILRSWQTKGSQRRAPEVGFDTVAFIEDFMKAAARHNWSRSKAALRVGVNDATISLLRNGQAKNMSVQTMARLMSIMNNPDINKYIIYED